MNWGTIPPGRATRWRTVRRLATAVPDRRCRCGEHGRALGHESVLGERGRRRQRRRRRPSGAACAYPRGIWPPRRCAAESGETIVARAVVSVPYSLEHHHGPIVIERSLLDLSAG